MASLLEPSCEAQLGSRTPVMPGERHERGERDFCGHNTRERERGLRTAQLPQLLRLLIHVYTYAFHGYMPGLEAEPRAMPHTERDAAPFLCDVRCVPQCSPWRSHTPNDPGDIVTKHASGHASPLA